MKSNEEAASPPAVAEPDTQYMPLFFDPLEELTGHRSIRRAQSAPAGPWKSSIQRPRSGKRSRDRALDRRAMLEMVVHDLHALGDLVKSTGNN
ncbi:hypothetical protein SB659_17690 [Arthrobacter sp. SIMBA_036]|uniref:hypothetical protein n=1 Tax=Arthrobacter sp. SIMBA_036 TaxID=3085778 RepID=UPI00397A7E35